MPLDGTSQLVTLGEPLLFGPDPSGRFESTPDGVRAVHRGCGAGWTTRLPRNAAIRTRLRESV